MDSNDNWVARIQSGFKKSRRSRFVTFSLVDSERRSESSVSDLLTVAAARRFQAVQWLKSVVGQLGIPNQPSEKEFISCLRNGMILCNAINKIHPGAVSKVLFAFYSILQIPRKLE